MDKRLLKTVVPVVAGLPLLLPLTAYGDKKLIPVPEQFDSDGKSPNNRTELGRLLSEEDKDEVRRLNPTTVEVRLEDGKRMTFDFYGEKIFRLFRDDNGGVVRDPQAKPEAKIMVDNPRQSVSKLDIQKKGSAVALTTDKIRVFIDRKTGQFKVIDLERDGRVVVETAEPIRFENGKSHLTLKKKDKEYFYGGGVQNGRFSHKGKVVAIENQNSWTDGGVASPTPFYWSTGGYGVMWHSFKKGSYDLGATDKGLVKLSHDENYLDMFIMVNDGMVPLLNDFYQLTGKPVLMPKFGFYQGHLNAYNRDFWKEDPKGILFEDGKRYKESQKDNGGIKESLNGEKNNYLFSARAVVDRYKTHDMPLGWVLPNDGYGAGYGQEDTLDKNVANLKEFGAYAKKHGVEIGLWTQSDLHPKPGISALLQRDIVKEVRDAGVRVLKTDVAWVGPGYSFGLNGITDAAQIMTYYGDNARPFIISLDGWAGTQRFAAIWTGDQTGGEWEYIRFHIPTYIGSGLSGQPNIGSDMDGIFGGKNPFVNVRDFQWKTFTPLELNMDGWGSNEKYPHALGEPYTSINRWYLKLKSELMPYIYSIAEESVDGLPMIRPMFVEESNPYTQGKATQYQFMFGPYFLIAPIYRDTQLVKDGKDAGKDVRHGVYMPKGQWVDYFTGHIYEGGKIYNDIEMPLWKLPVYVKNGAIIPMTHPHNNVYEIDKALRVYEVYPYGKSSFTEYDDDGLTEAYRKGACVRTLIESKVEGNKAVITVHPATGDFDGFVKNKATEFRVNVTAKPADVKVTVNNEIVALKEVTTQEDFEKGTNVYFYNQAPNLNKFATKGSDFAKLVITKNPQLFVKLAASDTTANATVLTVDGFKFEPADHLRASTGEVAAPAELAVTEENCGPYTLKPTWKPVPNADYYEIEFEGMLYSGIRQNGLLFEDLAAETEYAFKVRSVNLHDQSAWVTLKAKTKSNPLEFAIPGITATCTAPGQNNVKLLFDFQEKDDWHTKYNAKAVPFDLVMDLKTVNKLDKFHYVPRKDVGNGTMLTGKVYYSMDKESWTEAGAFTWDRTADVKVFPFKGNPTARYIKLHADTAVGDYGSGKEIYVFKVPGTESYLPGDINKDNKVDSNDFVSYTNYTGLRKGDGDFDYVSIGDINGNGVLDAYDISVVATQLSPDDQVSAQEAAGTGPLNGTLSITADKAKYAASEIVTITVKGTDLKAVNALGFALPYNPADYEFVKVENMKLGKMTNLTNDRLHTDGAKVLYPTFVNCGLQKPVEGTLDVFQIKLKARRDVTFNLKMKDGILVDKDLKSKKL